MSGTKIILIIALPIILVACSIYEYYYSYRLANQQLFLYGVLIVIFILASIIRGGERNKRKNEVEKFVLPITIVGLIVFVIISFAGSKRMDRILSGNATAYTKGVVELVKTIHSRRHGTTYYYTLTYSTEREKIVMSIRKEVYLYKKLDTVDVKYSLEYPDMYKIIPRN